jgi:nicotinamidase-related amidase
MTLTTLDPVPALVLVDLQKGIVGIPAAHPSEDVVARAAELAAAFRARGLPVVLVDVSGRAPGRTDEGGAGGGGAFAGLPDDWMELAPELDAQPGDLRVTKQTWGAFHGTTLDAQLREHGVTLVVLGGISTSAGVETTARAAYEHGYNVVLVADAMTDRDADVHANSVERIFPRLGEVTTTAEVLERLG